MEIKTTIEFTTKIYGSAAAKGYTQVLADYIEKRQDEGLLTFAQQHMKKTQTVDDMVVDILSVFNRNGTSEPIIGDWMLRKCLTGTGMAIFNAAKDKTQPNKQLIPMAVVAIEPGHSNFYDPKTGKIIEKAEGVDTYAVTIPTKPGQKGRSFFKAYEFMRPGYHMDWKIIFDDEIVQEQWLQFWIEKAGLIGLGAFRERFGKFKVVKFEM